MKHLALAAACVALLAAPAWGQWSDDFQAYAVGSQISGQGGWAGWNDTAYTTAVVADDPGTPGVGDNALKLVTSNNMIRTFGATDYVSGRWVFTAYQYIPSAAHTNSSATNTLNFYLMNNYVSGTSGAKGYGVQLNFNLGTAATTSDTVADAADGGTLLVVYNQWVEIRVEINLDSNYRVTYYNGARLGLSRWYNPADTSQANAVAAVDLPVNSATNLAVYYDDMSIAAGSGGACPDPALEDFQAYALDSTLCGQCRWIGWDGATFDAVVTSDPAGTEGNQVLKEFANNDMVQEYAGYTSGAWVYSAKQYIPSTQHGVGNTSFILMNKYGAGANSPRGWAVSLNFDLINDVISDAEAGEGGVAIVYDQWMSIRVEIDLDANIRTTYYVNPVAGTTTQIGRTYWYDEFSPSHAKSIAAVDLWADVGGNPIYYDDVKIEAGTAFVRPPGTDLTTTSRGSVASRYLVDLGQLYNGSNPPAYVGGNGSTIRPYLYVPQGLYEITNAGGNRSDPAGNWNYWNKLNDGRYGGGGDLVTWGTSSVDYFGYKFKLPATVTSIEFWNDTRFGDGGPFAAVPAVQYLDTMNGTTWQTIPPENLTWDHPYNTTFGGGVRRYVITLTNPPTAIWGLRLYGQGAGSGDGNGFVGVTELTLYGNLELGTLDTTTNLARVAGTGASAIAFPVHGTLANLIDGNLTTAFDTWCNTNWSAASVPAQTDYYVSEDYLGVAWTTPQNNVAAMGVVFAGYRDGGYFGYFGGGACDPGTAPFRIEYTTGANVAADARLVTWTPVTNLNIGRYAQDWRTIHLFPPWTWSCSTGYLFRFDPVSGITGLRIIGRAGKVSVDGDGFVGAYEIEAYANSQ